MQQSSVRRSSESGGIVSFLLIGIVLLGLLGGGLWLIKNRHDTMANVDVVSETVKDQAQTKPQTQPSATNPNATAGTSGSTATTDNLPAPTTPSTSTPAPQAASPSAVAATGPTHIASTGPVDIFAHSFLLSSLVLVGYFYQRSRQAIR